MKVKEVAVVPHVDGLLLVCYLDEEKKTQQILLSKEQAVFLTRELKNILYKMGYKSPLEEVHQP